MKRIKLLQLAAFCMFLLLAGCNNSGTGPTTKDTTVTTTVDTTANTDSISSNPDAMSDPH